MRFQVLRPTQPPCTARTHVGRLGVGGTAARSHFKRGIKRMHKSEVTLQKVSSVMSFRPGRSTSLCRPIPARPSCAVVHPSPTAAAGGVSMGPEPASQWCAGNAFFVFAQGLTGAKGEKGEGGGRASRSSGSGVGPLAPRLGAHAFGALVQDVAEEGVVAVFFGVVDANVSATPSAHATHHKREDGKRGGKHAAADCPGGDTCAPAPDKTDKCTPGCCARGRAESSRSCA